jgi:hypothetical protein
VTQGWALTLEIVCYFFLFFLFVFLLGMVPQTTQEINQELRSNRPCGMLCQQRAIEAAKGTNSPKYSQKKNKKIIMQLALSLCRRFMHK